MPDASRSVFDRTAKRCRAASASSPAPAAAMACFDLGSAARLARALQPWRWIAEEPGWEVIACTMQPMPPKSRTAFSCAAPALRFCSAAQQYACISLRATACASALAAAASASAAASSATFSASAVRGDICDPSSDPLDSSSRTSSRSSTSLILRASRAAASSSASAALCAASSASLLAWASAASSLICSELGNSFMAQMIRWIAPFCSRSGVIAASSARLYSAAHAQCCTPTDSPSLPHPQQASGANERTTSVRRGCRGALLIDAVGLHAA